jgi:hypothetical protein
MRMMKGKKADDCLLFVGRRKKEKEKEKERCPSMIKGKNFVF